MKFFLLAFLLPLFAQGQTSTLPETVGNDYDYTYFPSPVYLLLSELRVLDTATQNLVWKKDSLPQIAQVIVDKEGDRLTISGTANTSQTFYRNIVKFISTIDGVTTYEAVTETKEMVLVCPGGGWAMLAFRDKEAANTPVKKPGQKQNYIVHYFGKVPPKYAKP